MKNVLFAEDLDLCDAKFNKYNIKNVLEITCSKGKLHVEGDIVTQFRVCCSWCQGCEKKHIISRKDLAKAFEGVSKQLLKEFGQDEDEMR